jgi:hypothetical protein
MFGVESLKNLDLLAQLLRRMQNFQCSRNSRGGLIMAPGGQVRRFSQTHHRQKQKHKPGAAADITGVVAGKQPRDSSNRENDQGRDSPPAKNSAGPPCPRQHQQRSN